MTDDVKISLVRRRAPHDLRKHLQLNAQCYADSYTSLHDVVEAYWSALEEESAPQSFASDQPMEIDFVRRGKGKSVDDKGRGKGFIYSGESFRLEV